MKDKEKEINFNEHNTPDNDTTHLNVSDFTDNFTDNRNWDNYNFKYVVITYFIFNYEEYVIYVIFKLIKCHTLQLFDVFTLII